MIIISFLAEDTDLALKNCFYGEISLISEICSIILLSINLLSSNNLLFFS